MQVRYAEEARTRDRCVKEVLSIRNTYALQGNSGSTYSKGTVSSEAARQEGAVHGRSGQEAADLSRAAGSRCRREEAGKRAQQQELKKKGSTSFSKQCRGE